VAAATGTLQRAGIRQAVLADVKRTNERRGGNAHNGRDQVRRFRRGEEMPQYSSKPRG
jgi:hypothetical protein